MSFVPSVIGDARLGELMVRELMVRPALGIKRICLIPNAGLTLVSFAPAVPVTSLMTSVTMAEVSGVDLEI